MKTCWTFEILWFIAIEIFFCIRIFSPKSSYLTTIHFAYKRFNLCVSNAMPWLHNKAGKQTNLCGLMKRTFSTKHWENSLPVSRISINYELHNNCIHLVEYVLCERAIMFLRMALCHRISNTYCVAWTMMSTEMPTMNKWYQEVYVMCHVLCIPLDHYSTLYAKQKKNVRQQQNSIHFSLSLFIIHGEIHTFLDGNDVDAYYFVYIIVHAIHSMKFKLCQFRAECVAFRMYPSRALEFDRRRKKRMEMFLWMLVSIHKWADSILFDDFSYAKRANVHSHLITSWFLIWIKTHKAHLLQWKCASKKKNEPHLIYLKAR